MEIRVSGCWVSEFLRAPLKCPLKKPTITFSSQSENNAIEKSLLFKWPWTTIAFDLKCGLNFHSYILNCSLPYPNVSYQILMYFVQEDALLEFWKCFCRPRRTSFRGSAAMSWWVGVGAWHGTPAAMEKITETTWNFQVLFPRHPD